MNAVSRKARNRTALSTAAWITACLLLYFASVSRAQAPAVQTPGNVPAQAAPAGAPAGDPAEWRYRVETLGLENAVSNSYGNWYGGGASVAFRPSHREQLIGGFVAESRPGDNEQMGWARIVADWSKWFYTDTTFSGGGRDDPAAFFPRFRYDLSGNIKPPAAPGLIVSVGFTGMHFGAPNQLAIVRLGGLYYWRRFVFQANVNLNQSQPGSRRSQSGDAALQYGREGRYWIGAAGGGGTQAWQTLTFAPQNVELTSYSTSIFARKWLTPRYGVETLYRYTLLRTAYQINEVDVKFFWDW